MIFALLVWVVYAAIAYGFGAALLTWVSPKWDKRQKKLPHPTLIILAGCAVLAPLATTLSFFIPLGTGVSLAMAGIGIALIGFYRKQIRENLSGYFNEISAYPWFLLMGFSLILFFSLINAVIPTQQFDEGLYYTPSIRWLQEYGTVVGLGNLHAKLSFNSSWHTLSALMGMSLSQLNDLNPFLQIIAGLFAFQGMASIYHKKYSLGNFFQALVIVPTHLFAGTDMNSPAPDYVVMTLLLIIFTLFIQKVERETLKQFDSHSFLIVLLGAFAVTVKLSAAPMLILPAYLFWLQLRKKNYTYPALMMITGLLIVSPWLIRNVMLSGYLVYPAHQIDLFSFEWEVPHEVVALEVDETRAFSKIRKFNYAEVREMKPAVWLPFWVGEMRPGEKMVLLFVFASTFCYLGFAAAKRKLLFTEKGLGYLVAILTLYVGVAYWFLAAPAMRFGYGHTVPIYLLVAAWIFWQLMTLKKESRLGKRFNFKHWVYVGFCLVCLAFYLKGFSYSFKNYVNSFQVAEILFPPTLPGCDCATATLDGHPILIPNGTAQCFNSSLPCSPLVMDALHLRGENLGDGFVMKGADPAEYERRRIERMKADREILLGKEAGDFQYKKPE